MLMFLLSAFLFSGSVKAATGVPEIINFQGRLMSDTGELLGVPSGTDYCYKFSIWDVSTGGTQNPNQLWPSGFTDPTPMTISTRSGVFDASIGGGADTLDYNFQDDDEVYVDVEVAEEVGDCTTGADEDWETL